MKRFEITFFYGPRPNRYGYEETYTMMAESGITLAQMQGTPEEIKIALKGCAAAGVRVNVSDRRVWKAMEADEAECDRIVAEICADYAGYEALNGFDLVDEPHCSAFDGLGRVVAAFRRHAPQCETVINLYPDQAFLESLGNASYEEHLEDFVTRVKPDFISYDHYHFFGRDCPRPTLSPTGDRRGDLILQTAFCEHDRPSFLGNAEKVHRCARAHGLDAMCIVLLTEHGMYRNLTRAELSWEVNMCLAYGFRRISFFTYALPVGDRDGVWRWDNAMVDPEGNKYQHYYDVQAISKWLRPLGEHLFPLDCEQVCDTTTDTVCHGNIRGITGEAVAGCYSDGSVLVVNKSHMLSETFTVAADTLTRYDIETDRFVPCDTTFTLEAGQSILIK